MPNTIWIAVLSLAVPIGLSAARLTLRDGTVINGRMISGSTASIVFQDDTGRRTVYDVDLISTIDFNPVNVPNPADGQDHAPAPVYGQDRSYTQRANEQQRAADQYDQNTANRGEERPRGVWATLPPGTEISVRTDEEIKSRTSVEGRIYRAAIQRDIADDHGNILIPSGSDASLIIRRASDGQFLLDLDSVRVGGRNYVVTGTDVAEGGGQGIGRNKRTAEMVGGGAALGTLLGAVAGGGKGAAIGAAAGAAAGGGVEVLTRGREVRVPAETVLQYRLEEPLRLREM